MDIMHMVYVADILVCVTHQYFLEILITPTQVMVYHWWIPCETLVHTGSR